LGNTSTAPRADQTTGVDALAGRSFPETAAGLRKGVTVAGEVKNYVRVTDEMLRHPDPGDWLMIRGNYQAWSHSTLSQITRENVKGWEREGAEAGLDLGDE